MAMAVHAERMEGNPFGLSMAKDVSECKRVV
jgi:hypothetical protein